MLSAEASKNILVVEDDQSIREAMQLYLEMEGYQVQTAADGRQALDLLGNKLAPCLILLDLMMPIMDGYEFLKARKENTSISSIPVVVVSAFLDNAIDVDAQGFVSKPIDFDVLLKYIRQYCC